MRSKKQASLRSKATEKIVTPQSIAMDLSNRIILKLGNASCIDPDWRDAYVRATKGNRKAFDFLMSLRKVDYCHQDIEVFTLIYQWLTLAQSYPYYPMSTDIDREQVALDGYLANEVSCKVMNNKLNNPTRNPYVFLGKTLDEQYEIQCIIERAQIIVKQILGPLPTDVQGNHSNGATFHAKGSFRQLPYKLSFTDVSPDASILALSLADDIMLEAIKATGFSFVYGSRMAFVDKDAVTKRAINVEPTLNMFVQQAYRRPMEARLRKVGIFISDLSEAKDEFAERKRILGNRATRRRVEVLSPNKHGDYARRGSIDGWLATLDLVSSSDLVCYELVQLLCALVPDWLAILNATRSPCVKIKNDWHTLEKFASMGNALIFPLQTLLYYAICKAICELNHINGDVSVFGDDLILPTPAAEIFIRISQELGMKVNGKKSYLGAHPYRESCGYDWVSGKRIFKFKLTVPDNGVSGHTVIYNLYNGVSRLCWYDERSYFRFSRIYSATLRLVDDYYRATFPSHKPIYIPVYGPDSGGFKTADCTKWEVKASRTNDGKYTGSRVYKCSIDRAQKTTLDYISCEDTINGSTFKAGNREVSDFWFAAALKGVVGITKQTGRNEYTWVYLK